MEKAILPKHVITLFRHAGEAQLPSDRLLEAGVAAVQCSLGGIPSVCIPCPAQTQYSSHIYSSKTIAWADGRRKRPKHANTLPYPVIPTKLSGWKVTYQPVAWLLPCSFSLQEAGHAVFWAVLCGLEVCNEAGSLLEAELFCLACCWAERLLHYSL